MCKFFMVSVLALLVGTSNSFAAAALLANGESGEINFVSITNETLVVTTPNQVCVIPFQLLQTNGIDWVTLKNELESKSPNSLRLICHFEKGQTSQTPYSFTLSYKFN